MKLLSFVLFIALETLLVVFASSSTCPPLNRTLFNDCIQAGYNVSNFTSSRTQNELSGLIANMQNKFKNCSSLSSLMTCSVHLPKCSAGTSTLPCKEVCKNFVADCQQSSSENDGLIALFRGICELLPSSKCLLKPNNLNNTNSEAVKCERLVIKQCQNAGYNFTSVSNTYQKIVESSAIFQDSNANPTLRKIMCIEIAPPCDAKNNQKLLVPCRSTCDKAFNESRSKFLKIFKAQDYCSAFPENTTVDGKEYCSLKAWPVNGYWPSGLWTSLTSAAQQQNCTLVAPKWNVTTPTSNVTTPASTSNVTTPAPTSNVITPATTSNVATPAPTANGTTPAPTSLVTTPAPTANGTTPAPTSLVTTPALTANGTTPAPASLVTTPAPTANGTTPAPTSLVTTPAPTSLVTTPAPTSLVTTPAPTSLVTTPATTSLVTTPAPKANGTTPASTPNVTTPAPTPNVTTPASTPNVTTPAPTPNVTTPASTPNVTTPAPTSNVTTIAPKTTNGTAPAPTSNVTTLSPKSNVSTPAPTTNGTKPTPTSHITTPAATSKKTTTEPHKSSTSSNPLSGTKGSPPVVSAHKGGKMSGGAIAGTVLGILALLVAIVVGVICFRKHRRARSQYSHSLMVDMDEL